MLHSVALLATLGGIEASVRRLATAEEERNDGGVCEAVEEEVEKDVFKWKNQAKDPAMSEFCQYKFTPQITIRPTLDIELKDLDWPRTLPSGNEYRFQGIEMVTVVNHFQSEIYPVDFAHRAYLKVQKYNEEQDKLIEENEDIQRAYNLFNTVGSRENSPVNHIRISAFDCRLGLLADKPIEEVFDDHENMPQQDKEDNFEIFKGIQNQCNVLFKEVDDTSEAFSLDNLVTQMYIVRGCGESKSIHFSDSEDDMFNQLNAYIEEHCHDSLDGVNDFLASLPTWAIVLIVIAVLIVLFLICFLIYWCCFRSKDKGVRGDKAREEDEEYYEDVDDQAYGPKAGAYDANAQHAKLEE